MISGVKRVANLKKLKVLHLEDLQGTGLFNLHLKFPLKATIGIPLGCQVDIPALVLCVFIK